MHMQEQDLKQVFEAFGAVDYITLQKDPTGRSQGYGFVQYVPFPLHDASLKAGRCRILL